MSPVYMARALRNPVGEWRIVCGGTSRATTYRPVIFSHIWQRNANAMLSALGDIQ